MQNETAKATIYLDGKQAEAAIDALKQKSKELKVQLDAAKKAGDNITMKKLENEIRSVDAASRSLLKDSFDVEKVLKNINKISWRDLEKAQKAVVSEMKRMERGTDAYAAKAKNLEKITTELNKTRGVLKQKESMWGSLANGANKYFNMITLGIATLTGVVFSMSQFIKGMVGLDDALADVMKTTGLTRKEVREMYQDFRYLNTRTPRAELLLLAEEAGRLGKTGKKDIMDFVEVANKIKISLGDDLGGNTELAIREVGKLTEIFQVGQQYNTDYKTSLEKVGSGLNQVANNSNASAGYLIEYMKRLGGISTQAKITAADIMGYASTFDQLGQNVEMAATAQSKVVVDMFTDPGKYAKIAKMEVGDFSKMLKTDANEAFIKFLEGLNGNNEGLSVMATKLDALGIDGARATQALAALSSNTKMLREQQILANDAMQKGTSLNTEYAIKNNNLAASWEKLTVFIRSKFISSSFINYLENIIGKMAKITEVSRADIFVKQQQEVNGLTTELTDLNTSLDRRREILKKLNEISPEIVKGLNAEAIAIDTLRVNLEAYNTEMTNKIILSHLEDDEQKQAAIAAKSKEAWANAMADVHQIIGKTNTELATSEISLQEKIQRTIALLKEKATGSMQVNQAGVLVDSRNQEQKYLENIIYLTGVIEKEQINVNKAVADQKGFSERAKIIRELLGLNKQIASNPEGNGDDPNSIITDPKEIKKASDKAIEALDAANNERTAKLITQYETEGWSDAKFKAEMLAAEQAYLLMKQALLTQFGQSTVDGDNQINAKRIEAQKQANADMKAAMDEAEKDHEAHMKRVNETEDLAIDEMIKKTNESLNNIEKAKDKEADILQQRQQNYLDFAMNAGQAFGDLMNDNEATMADYLKTTLVMALEAFHQFFLIEKAKAIISGMGKGPVGIAIAIAKVIAMEIAYQAVKSALTKKNKQSGGFSNTDGPDNEPDGIYHKGEFIASAPAVRNPTVKPILDVIDMAQRSGTIRSLNLSAMIPAGKQSGGYASSPSSAIVAPGSAAGIPEATAMQFIKAIDKLTAWEPSLAVETYEKKRENYNKIRSGGLK